MAKSATTTRILWLWLLAAELLVIVCLVPGAYVEEVIEEEAVLLESRLGATERNWVHSTAKDWFNTTLIDNGAYSAAYHHIIPTEAERKASLGMENMATLWFQYADERLVSMANMYYQFLARLAHLVTWLPYILVLFIPALYDGLVSWKIKRSNFAYTSPLIHSYASRASGWMLGLTIAVFLAPLALDPVFIPIVLMVLCVLIGLFVGNMQKRI